MTGIVEEELVPLGVVQDFDRMDGEIRVYRLNLVVNIVGIDVFRVIII
jgi:hypothetical protein